MIPDRMGTRLGVVAVLLLLATGTGLADQYWVAYEGNDYPEDVGWERFVGTIPAERTLEEGSLLLDMRADPLMSEFYEWPTGGHVDPDPGEVLVMQWRLRVDEVSGWSGPTILVGGEDGACGAFTFHEDRVRAAYHAGVEAYFEPGVFHEFEFRSYDMVEYELYIDGQLAIEHILKPHTSHVSRMAWGDGAVGETSLTTWDYVRFGVIPEPSAALSFLALIGLHSGLRAGIRRRDSRQKRLLLAEENNNE